MLELIFRLNRRDGEGVIHTTHKRPNRILSQWSVGSIPLPGDPGKAFTLNHAGFLPTTISGNKHTPLVMNCSVAALQHILCPLLNYPPSEPPNC